MGRSPYAATARIIRRSFVPIHWSRRTFLKAATVTTATTFIPRAFKASVAGDYGLVASTLPFCWHFLPSKSTNFPVFFPVSREF
jgi:hypothetical protein